MPRPAPPCAPRGPSRAPRALLALAFLTVAPVACSRDGVPQAEEEINARLRALRLAEAPVSPRAAVARETRVVLTPQGIDVDNVALFTLSDQRSRDKFRRKLPPAQAADVPLVARAAVRLTAWQPAPEHAPPPGALDLPSLRPILDRAAAVDLSNGASREIPLRLYIPEDAPYGLVARTISTAAAAGYVDQRLPVRAAQAQSEINLHSIPDIGANRTCYRLWVVLSPRGATLRILPPDPAPLAHVVPAPVLPSPSAAQALPPALSRPLRGPGGACPTVPRRDARHDLDAIAARVAEVRGASPLVCGHTGVVANESAPWSDVAPVLAKAAPVQFVGLVLGGAVPDARAEPPDCDAAVALDAVGAAIDDAMRKEFWKDRPF